MFEMSASDWELCARVVEVFPGFYLLLVKTLTGAGNGFYESAPMQLPVFVAPWGPTAEHPHFPWGIEVFPD